MPSRRVLLVVVLAVVLAAGAVTTGWLVRRPGPVPPGGVTTPGCPSLLPGTLDAVQDFADLVVWRGRTYVSGSDKDADVGTQLGTVTCSIEQMDNPDHWRIGPTPWPDGTATGLVNGTPLYVATGYEPGRALVARTADGDRLYCAADDSLVPTC